jgi:serine/threonine-protein kinase PknG
MFCDFKPDNVMQTPNGLKLIDLGGVFRIDDPTSAVYGTVGYQAPEIAGTGPTPTSDLYTVARSLAVMSTVFNGYQSTYRFGLPARDDVPEYRAAPGLYRFLARATAPNPDDRFQTADEMAAQLLGVLREVVATSTGMPAPGTSTLFTPELNRAHDARDWRALPALQVSADDDNAAFLAALGVVESEQLVAMLRALPDPTVEVTLRLARALLEIGEHAAAEQLLDETLADDPWEWRVAWYRSLIALDENEPDRARANLETILDVVPGELAPQLALGLACEAANDHAAAVCWYDVVSRTDPSYTSACFGLARCRIELGNRMGAIEAYERVSRTSHAYVDAQVEKVRALVDPDACTTDDVVAAGTVVEHLPLERERAARLTVAVFEAALGLVRPDDLAPGVDGQTVLGCRLTDREVRVGLETAYRRLAQHAASVHDRVALIDRANEVRPRTLL